jgi:hypothetical protein
VKPVRYLRLIAPLRRLACALALALGAGLASSAAAHDIPADVKINAFFKPAGDRLEWLIRMPLASLLDADFPTRGPGYVDLARADDAIRTGIKVWLTDSIDVYENGALLPKPRVVAALVTLPSDKSFASFEEARAHVLGPPLGNDLDLYWNQQLVDVLLEYKIQSDRSEFAVEMRVERLGLAVTTALRFLPPDGAIRAFEFHGNPGLLYLDPR